jgi:hypothetical protein
MSVVVMAKGSNGIAVASDGITYDDDGIVRGITSKIEPLIHLNCLIAQVGAGGLSLALRQAMGHKYKTFDEMLHGIADDLRLATECMVQWTLFGRNPDSTVAIAGYSDERNAFELYRISNWNKKVAGSSEVNEFEAYTLVPVEYFWTNIVPADEYLERFRLNGDEMQKSPGMLAARWVAACRPDSRPPDPEKELPAFGCGGFIELATLTQEGFSSRIIHRWPDEIGKVIDGSVGELLPRWMLPD